VFLELTRSDHRPIPLIVHVDAVSAITDDPLCTVVRTKDGEEWLVTESVSAIRRKLVELCLLHSVEGADE